MGKIGYHQIPFGSGCPFMTCTMIHWSIAQIPGITPRNSPHRFLKHRSEIARARMSAGENSCSFVLRISGQEVKMSHYLQTIKQRVSQGVEGYCAGHICCVCLFLILLPTCADALGRSISICSSDKESMKGG